MSKIRLAELLEQDVRELEGIFLYKEYELTEEQAQRLARGIFENLKDHLEELIKS